MEASLNMAWVSLLVKVEEKMWTNHAKFTAVAAGTSGTRIIQTFKENQAEPKTDLP